MFYVTYRQIENKKTKNTCTESGELENVVLLCVLCYLDKGSGFLKLHFGSNPINGTSTSSIEMPPC